MDVSKFSRRGAAVRSGQVRRRAELAAASKFCLICVRVAPRRRGRVLAVVATWGAAGVGGETILRAAADARRSTRSRLPQARKNPARPTITPPQRRQRQTRNDDFLRSSTPRGARRKPRRLSNRVEISPRATTTSDRSTPPRGTRARTLGPPAERKTDRNARRRSEGRTCAESVLTLAVPKHDCAPLWHFSHSPRPRVVGAGC